MREVGQANLGSSVPWAHSMIGQLQGLGVRNQESKVQFRGRRCCSVPQDGLGGPCEGLRDLSVHPDSQQAEHGQAAPMAEGEPGTRDYFLCSRGV